MSNSWWAKKLGGTAPPPPPARPSPYAPVLPQGVGVNHDRAMAHYMQRHDIDQQPQPQQPTGLNVQQVGPNEVAVLGGGGMPMDGDPNDYHRRLWGWTGNSRNGGAKETMTTGECPQCGSPRYFSRSNGSIMNKDGISCVPKPECFECGYPNDQGVLAAQPSQRLPGVKGARQQSVHDQFLRPMAPDGSVATLVKH